MNKKEIRKHHLKIRQEMSPTNVKDNSVLINDRILNLLNKFNSAKSIGLFYPYKNEVDVILMALELEKRGLACLLPKVINEHNPLKYFFYSPNSSKLEKGMTINTSNEKGADIVRELIKDADIFLTNVRPTSLERSKLDHETLLKINPKLIYCSLSGYGLDGKEREEI